MPKDFSIKPYVQAQGGAFTYKTPSIEYENSFQRIHHFDGEVVELNSAKNVNQKSKTEVQELYGVTFGAKVQKGNAYADAGILVGNKFKADFKVGYEFNLGNELGLDLSAHAQHIGNMPTTSGKSAKPTGEKPIYTTIWQYNGEITPEMRAAAEKSTEREIFEREQKDSALPLDHTIDVQNEVKANTHVGISAELKYKPSWGTIGVGAEAGCLSTKTRTDITTNINGGYSNVSYYFDNTRKDTSTSSLYATPTINAQVNLGKGFSLNADADLRQANAGLRYTF